MSILKYLIEKINVNESVENLDSKLEALKNLVKKEKLETLKRDYPGPMSTEEYTDARILPGKKYTKIDVKRCGQWSGSLMVNNETGDIYSIKGYGVPNLISKHHYGTLDTIHDYFWGDYYPVKKSVKESVIKEEYEEFLFSNDKDEDIVVKTKYQKVYKVIDHNGKDITVDKGNRDFKGMGIDDFKKYLRTDGFYYVGYEYFGKDRIKESIEESLDPFAAVLVAHLKYYKDNKESFIDAVKNIASLYKFGTFKTPESLQERLERRGLILKSTSPQALENLFNNLKKIEK